MARFRMTKSTAKTPLPARLEILRVDHISEVLGVSRNTIWRWLQDVEVGFPRPIRLGSKGSKAIGWRRSEFFEWLENRPLLDEGKALSKN